MRVWVSHLAITSEDPTSLPIGFCRPASQCVRRPHLHACLNPDLILSLVTHMAHKSIPLSFLYAGMPDRISVKLYLRVSLLILRL